MRKPDQERERQGKFARTRMPSLPLASGSLIVQQNSNRRTRISASIMIGQSEAVRRSEGDLSQAQSSIESSAFMAALRNKRLIAAHCIATPYIYIYIYTLGDAKSREPNDSKPEWNRARYRSAIRKRRLRKKRTVSNVGLYHTRHTCRNTIYTIACGAILVIRYYNLRRFVRRAIRYASILGCCRDANDAAICSWKAFSQLGYVGK